MALQSKRIQPGRSELFWDELAALPIAVEPSLSPEQAKIVLALCEQSGLTAYDGASLELAKRQNLPGATLDSALLKAAPLECVALVPQP